MPNQRTRKALGLCRLEAGAGAAPELEQSQFSCVLLVALLGFLLSAVEGWKGRADSVISRLLWLLCFSFHPPFKPRSAELQHQVSALLVVISRAWTEPWFGAEPANLSPLFQLPETHRGEKENSGLRNYPHSSQRVRGLSCCSPRQQNP